MAGFAPQCTSRMAQSVSAEDRSLQRSRRASNCRNSGKWPNAGGMADLSLAQRTHAGVANAGEYPTYLGVF
jgi:hypothetical protein